MSAASGWYDDGSGRRRWWDGSQWTSHFADQHPTSAAPPVEEPRETETVRASKPKITFFGGKKAAIALASENERLEKLVAKHGLIEIAELDRVHAEYQAQVDAEKSNLSELQSRVASTKAELSSLNEEILSARQGIELQSFGLYDYEHPAENSTALMAQLESVRSQIKAMVRDKRATIATTNFTFNNSAAKGRKFVADMSKLLLRAYNAEAENCVKSVKAGGIATATKRLSTVADQIARQGSMISLQITSDYHALRLQELSLAAQHLQAVQREKELERAHREELREQKKAEQELQREKDKLEKERAHYAATLAALEANGDEEGAARVRERIADVEKAIVDVDYRAANIRAGYVYVISNVGSFGEDVVKIGLTRRLEPMDRVNELGDASVPFRFDVHALFFADDAVGIESMLHKRFERQRLNKINLRREYFKVTPEQVLDALKEESVEVLQYTVEPEAPEFRASSALLEKEAVGQ